MTESSSWAFQKPHEYYASFENRPHLSQKFHDIDDEAYFRPYLRLLENAQTQNFVLDFGNDDAWCAVNLDGDDIEALLRSPKPRCFGTRWINLWAPEEQKKSIKTIMSYYGVSERLQGIMCTEPVISTSKPVEPVVSSPEGHSSSSSVSHSKILDQQSHTRVDDLESGNPMDNMTDLEEIQKAASFKGLTFSQVTNQIWHFCSVDYGPRYICIGYNSLHVIPNVETSNGKDLPDGKRLWSWLILFDDGTVVSIQENPYPRPLGPLPEDEVKSVMGIVRRNARFIFSGVSKQHFAYSESESLVTIRVRSFHGDGPDHQGIKQDDSPSLLFYYIFDDWGSSYGLIARREHKYGLSLDHLREKMLDKPVVDLVNELHWLGRRLAVLKRLYQSYDIIMWRILQRQRMIRDEARSNRPPFTIGTTFGESEFADLRRPTMQSSLSCIGNHDTSVGVQLSSAATARFERLLDRIKLYCLSEIEACLVEKESLTFLNFNLIALKDSQAVEKLTRVTILLAKVTILFLPVSLMTGYFSTELKEVKGVYTVNQYWVSFGVIIFMSIVILVAFGMASGTVEGKPICQSLFRSFCRSSKQRISLERRS